MRKNTVIYGQYCLFLWIMIGISQSESISEKVPHGLRPSKTSRHGDHDGFTGCGFFRPCLRSDMQSTDTELHWRGYLFGRD